MLQTPAKCDVEIVFLSIQGKVIGLVKQAVKEVIAA
jgi:hypothetical protein